MPWKDVHKRINAKISSLPAADRQRYEQVRDIIMKESADADNTPVQSKGIRSNINNTPIAVASSNRMKQLTVLHDVLSVSGQDRYEHVRRNIMQSTAIADQIERQGGVIAVTHNQQVEQARADRSLRLKVLDLLEKYAPQPAPKPVEQPAPKPVVQNITSWQDAHQRINAKLSSMPESERQRYERVRDDIMKGTAFADNTTVPERGIRSSIHNAQLEQASRKRMKQLTVLHNVLSMPEQDRHNYDNVRRNIISETVLADQYEIQEGLKAAGRNKNIIEHKEYRSYQLEALDLLKTQAPKPVEQPTQQQSSQKDWDDSYKRIKDALDSSPDSVHRIAVKKAFKDIKNETSLDKQTSRMKEILESPDFRAMVNFSLKSVKQFRTTVNRPTEKVINVKTATVENLASMMNNMRKNMKKRLKTTADVGHANRDFFAGILRRKDA